jgi:hypothetical protein
MPVNDTGGKYFGQRFKLKFKGIIQLPARQVLPQFRIGTTILHTTIEYLQCQYDSYHLFSDFLIPERNDRLSPINLNSIAITRVDGRKYRCRWHAQRGHQGRRNSLSDDTSSSHHGLPVYEVSMRESPRVPEQALSTAEVAMEPVPEAVRVVPVPARVVETVPGPVWEQAPGKVPELASEVLMEVGLAPEAVPVKSLHHKRQAGR